MEPEGILISARLTEDYSLKTSSIKLTSLNLPKKGTFHFHRPNTEDTPMNTIRVGLISLYIMSVMAQVEIFMSAWLKVAIATLITGAIKLSSISGTLSEMQPNDPLYILYFIQANPEQTDNFMKSQSKMVGTDLKFHRTMSSMQSNSTRRLS